MIILTVCNQSPATTATPLIFKDHLTTLLGLSCPPLSHCQSWTPPHPPRLWHISLPPPLPLSWRPVFLTSSGSSPHGWAIAAAMPLEGTPSTCTGADTLHWATLSLHVETFPTLSGSGTVLGCPPHQHYLSLLGLSQPIPGRWHCRPLCACSLEPARALGTRQGNTLSQMPSRAHSGSDIPWQAATLLGCPPTSDWAPTLCAGQPCQADPSYFTQLPNPVRGYLPLPLHPQTPAFLSLTFALNYLGMEWEVMLFDDYF